MMMMMIMVMMMIMMTMTFWKIYIDGERIDRDFFGLASNSVECKSHVSGVL